MSAVTITGPGTPLGTSLTQLLSADEIIPGAAPSYQLCKTIYAYHPLGSKIAEKPVQIAQSQQREISIQKGPEDRLREAYLAEWKAIGADRHIFNTMTQARVYGVTSIAMIIEGQDTAQPIELEKLWNANLTFNTLDPLNTSGSMVLNQDPNAPDFQKIIGGIVVNGRAYHKSRVVVTMNENPLYIEYTSSGFGYVGRSCYQRALYPLKSFVQSMVTDDMVVRKAGLLIAMIKSAGSIIDNLMRKAGELKRWILKIGMTDNVVQIGQDDKVETLNMQNLDGAYGQARGNVIDNIASAVPMPAMLLKNETYAEGFGEGTEDAKATAQYIDELRKQMEPLYAFFDMVVKRRAWSPEFYKIIQADFADEYKGVPFNRAFYDWENSFTARWPSLLKEPPSEEIKIDDVKLKAIIALLEVLIPQCDPQNKAKLIQWAADNFNALKLLFDSHLTLDYEALANYQPPIPGFGPGAGEGEDGVDKTPGPGRPFGDSAVARRLDDFTKSVAAITDRKRPDRARQVARS